MLKGFINTMKKQKGEELIITEGTTVTQIQNDDHSEMYKLHYDPIKFRFNEISELFKENKLIINISDNHMFIFNVMYELLFMNGNVNKFDAEKDIILYMTHKPVNMATSIKSAYESNLRKNKISRKSYNIDLLNIKLPERNINKDEIKNYFNSVHNKNLRLAVIDTSDEILNAYDSYKFLIQLVNTYKIPIIIKTNDQLFRNIINSNFIPVHSYYNIYVKNRYNINLYLDESRFYEFKYDKNKIFKSIVTRVD